MKFMQISIRLFTTLFFLSFLTSCLFTQQIREGRKNSEIVQVYNEEQSDDRQAVDKESSELNVKIVTAQPVSDTAQYVWYHPNPWWKIKTEPFPVSADSFKYRMMRPQHGFSLFYHNDSTYDLSTWINWMNHNKMYNINEMSGHIWGSVIKKYFPEFEAHPEYLAEISNIRPGVTKSNKLCVSNRAVLNIFMKHCHDLMAKNINRKFISVEPSDGGKFCECSECQKLGGISNQVFHFAKLVADSMNKVYPDVQIHLYAYNFHSDTPSFKLPHNLIVAVAPAGFQSIYRYNMMLIEWAKHHNNLYLRDYFGIPQWTGDLPRIHVPTYITRTQLMRSLGYKAIIMESGINLNAAILSVLFNAMWLNESLSWDFIFNKFIHDCFPQSKVPIKRLFTRWHNHPFSQNEIGYALYDLEEAESVITDTDELMRLRDLQAYVHMFGLWHNWINDQQDITKLSLYFDYVYELGTRNLVNSRALYKSYERKFPRSSDLLKKYEVSNKPKDWAKYLVNDRIKKNFIDDKRIYGTELNDYVILEPQTIKRINFLPDDYFTNMSFSLRIRQEMQLLTEKSLLISLNKSILNGLNQPALITISNSDYSFTKSKLMNVGEKWLIDLPEKNLYIVSMHRSNLCNIEFDGNFIPIYTGELSIPVKDKVYSFQNDAFEKIEWNSMIHKTTPYKFILNR